MASAQLFTETRQVLASRLSWLALLGAFDPGWTKWGTLAMADSLLVLIAGATTAQVPWIAIAGLITATVVFLVRFVLLPPKPHRLPGASLHSHQTRIVLTLDRFAQALAYPKPRAYTDAPLCGPCVREHVDPTELLALSIS